MILSLAAGEQPIYVIECPSYQIDLAPSLNPSIGILANITRITRSSRTLEHYAALRAAGRAIDLSLVGVDDDLSAASNSGSTTPTTTSSGFPARCRGLFRARHPDRGKGATN